MEYSIKKLAQLSGVTTRTLRYYDEIGLLSPKRISSNDYRIYGQQEVELLQQILLYRELDVPLDEIKRIILSRDFDGKAALENHLSALLDKREQINRLITNVKKTISVMEGADEMNDKEKFEGFKQNMIAENEQQYGEEIRTLYGVDAVEKSNKKYLGMTRAQAAEVEQINLKMSELLKIAVAQGDPSSETAQQACDLHKKWLCYFWDSYSKAAHKGLAQMYVDDLRFTAYYDSIAPGCAVFLRDAIAIYCK